MNKLEVVEPTFLDKFMKHFPTITIMLNVIIVFTMGLITYSTNSSPSNISNYCFNVLYGINLGVSIACYFNIKNSKRELDLTEKIFQDLIESEARFISLIETKYAGTEKTELYKKRWENKKND